MNHSKANEICHKWVAILGHNFNIDTPAEDYVVVGIDEDYPFLNPQQIEEYEKDMEKLFSLMNLDPYSIAVNVMSGSK
jgi:hypothetical protein